MSCGAAFAEVVGASTAVGVVTAALLVLGWAHRTRRMTVLVRLSERIGAPTWRPGRVAVPVALLPASLLTALFGMLCDISLHTPRARHASLA